MTKLPVADSTTLLPLPVSFTVSPDEIVKFPVAVRVIGPLPVTPAVPLMLLVLRLVPSLTSIAPVFAASEPKVLESVNV